MFFVYLIKRFCLNSSAYNLTRYVAYLVPSVRKPVDPVDVTTYSMSKFSLPSYFVKIKSTSLTVKVCKIRYFGCYESLSRCTQTILRETCQITHETYDVINMHNRSACTEWASGHRKQHMLVRLMERGSVESSLLSKYFFIGRLFTVVYSAFSYLVLI